MGILMIITKTILESFLNYIFSLLLLFMLFVGIEVCVWFKELSQPILLVFFFFKFNF
jgi:hypothetical protein